MGEHGYGNTYRDPHLESTLDLIRSVRCVDLSRHHGHKFYRTVSRRGVQRGKDTRVDARGCRGCSDNIDQTQRRDFFLIQRIDR